MATSKQTSHTRVGNQLMRGLTIATVMFALAQAATPYVVEWPAVTQGWLAIATVTVIAYGLFLAITSPMIVQRVDRIRESDRIPLE